MAKTAASEDVLGALHSKVATVMTRALDQLGRAQERYEEAVDADPTNLELIALKPETPAALLGVMTKFLSDNKITCVPEESKEVSELAERLKNKRRRVGNIVHLVQED